MKVYYFSLNCSGLCLHSNAHHESKHYHKLDKPLIYSTLNTYATKDEEDF